MIKVLNISHFWRNIKMCIKSLVEGGVEGRSEEGRVASVCRQQTFQSSSLRFIEKLCQIPEDILLMLYEMKWIPTFTKQAIYQEVGWAE